VTVQVSVKSVAAAAAAVTASDDRPHQGRRR